MTDFSLGITMAVLTKLGLATPSALEKLVYAASCDNLSPDWRKVLNETNADCGYGWNGKE